MIELSTPLDIDNKIMANPIFACRIPDDDLQAFRDLCKRYNLDPGEAVKRFMAESVQNGCLPDRVLNPNTDSLSLQDRVSRLEARLEAIEAKKQSVAIAA